MKIVALAGGVGGAKLVDGFAQLLSSEDLTIIVNTGDDFEHLGFYISPDLDTVCYTLAGLANPDTGWGRNNDTFLALKNIQDLGGPDWFRIGDKDLATHLMRSLLMQDGKSLSQVTQTFCQAWGVRHLVLPMSDEPVRTMVSTVECGELAFQEYFVHQNCEPKVKGFRFARIDSAQPAPGVLDALEKSDAVVICPSNPWVSIDPILAVGDLRSVIASKTVVAVSPILAGKTVRGPAAKMYSEMGIEPSALAVSNHYADLLSGFVLDSSDSDMSGRFSIPITITKTLMKTIADRRHLAQDVLNLTQTIRSITR
jgi:LPPG:FO 2-phospho-L-lactate transferase